MLINSEARFFRSPDGRIWTETAFPYPYWQKYLSSFSCVRILARVRDAQMPNQSYQLVEGPGVMIVALPYYVGSLGFVFCARAIRTVMEKELKQRSLAVILVTPSPLSLIFERVVRARQYPYGVEVLGDPKEVFSAHGIRHPLRKFLRWWLARRQKSLVRDAKAALYVTQKSLQAAYPPGLNTFSIGVSNIDLRPAHLVEPKIPLHRLYGSAIRIVGVGSLEQMYKGVDILLQAMRILSDQQYDVSLTWIGGGYFLQGLILLSNQLGLQTRVNFSGNVSSGDSVRETLDTADLFVLPSRTEGLPRALVEAMARGLPCIGSNVGGIPELLERDELFPSEDAVAAASLIAKLIADPARRRSMALRNLEKSRAFLNEKLDEKKREFWAQLTAADSCGL